MNPSINEPVDIIINTTSSSQVVKDEINITNLRVCHFCSKPGHIARNCYDNPRRQKRGNKNKGSSSKTKILESDLRQQHLQSRGKEDGDREIRKNLEEEQQALAEEEIERKRLLAAAQEAEHLREIQEQLPISFSVERDKLPGEDDSLFSHVKPNKWPFFRIYFSLFLFMMFIVLFSSSLDNLFFQLLGEYGPVRSLSVNPRSLESFVLELKNKEEVKLLELLSFLMLNVFFLSLVIRQCCIYHCSAYRHLHRSTEFTLSNLDLSEENFDLRTDDEQRNKLKHNKILTCDVEIEHIAYTSNSKYTYQLYGKAIKIFQHRSLLKVSRNISYELFCQLIKHASIHVNLSHDTIVDKLNQHVAYLGTLNKNRHLLTHDVQSTIIVAAAWARHNKETVDNDNLFQFLQL